MSSTSSYLSLVLLILLLLFAFFLTMARYLFATIVTNFDATKDNSEQQRKIKQIYETPGFSETISFGRFASISIALLILQSKTAPFFSSISPIELALFIQIGILFPLLYAATVIFPGIVAARYPYALRNLTYFTFRFSQLFFAAPGKIANKIHTTLLDKTGHNPDSRYLTEEEWRKLEDDTSPLQDEDNLDEDERQMIHNIFEIGDTTAVSIMTPRIDVDALAASSDLATVSSTLSRFKRSRMPVYEESIDNVIGILHSKDFTEWITHPSRGEFQLKRMLRPAYFVPESKPILQMLREMRHKRNHLAIVVDEFGGTSGLVTFEDIIEEIVGEVYDEKDNNAPKVEELRPGVYLIDPQIGLGDLAEELNLKECDLEEQGDELDVETAGGLMQAMLGAIPRKGSHISVGPLQFRVLRVDGQRIVRMLVIMPDQYGEREKEKEEKNSSSTSDQSDS